MNAQDIADALKVDVNGLSTTIALAQSMTAVTRAGTDIGADWYIDTGVSDSAAVMIVKSAILARFDYITEICELAASRGYLLPDNPISTFHRLNATRMQWATLQITAEARAALEETTADLVAIVNGYDAGTITFDRSQPAAQMASFEVSVDGMTAQSGDALVDILGYQPDADFIKRKRALDSLGKLDFSKRKPYLLFTADSIIDGRRSTGTSVCWSRMRDASAYTISKRDVFGMVDFPDVLLTNDSLEASTAELGRDNLFAQTLSFYDWTGLNDVFAFVDKSSGPNTLYSYQVTGVQLRAPSSPFIFDVQMNALYLTPAQIAAVTDAVKAEQPAGSHRPLSISPYPAISTIVYGDPGYGWIIAGCNVLAGRRRGDTTEQTRNSSFIGSELGTLLTEATAGRLFIPSNIKSVQQAVERAISSYGVCQTLLSIMDGIGLTLFTSGKDDPLGFQPTQESLENATGGLAKILSAIDPQTATLDPSVLIAGLTVQSSSPFGSKYGAQQVVKQSAQHWAPTDFDSTVIDLTTYNGISRLMQLFRSIYDFLPGALA